MNIELRKEKVLFFPVIEISNIQGQSILRTLWVELEIAVGENGLITDVNCLTNINDEFKEEVSKQIKGLINEEFIRFFRLQKILDEERYCFLCLKRED